MKTTAAAFTLLSLAGMFLGSSCENKKGPEPEPQTGTMAVHLEHVAGNSPLALNSGSYTTAAGDNFKVSAFKYYLSNIQLTRADGTVWAEPESYRLVDQASTASQHLALADIPAGDYTRLTFTIGVDSARNMAGAQTGALDPLHGMYWDWTSGYVFMRLQGESAQSPSGAFGYDIIGFRQPHNAVRVISPALPHNTPLHIKASQTPEVHIKADVLKAFTGAHTIRLNAVYNVAGGADAVRLADNYGAGMFRIDHIHDNL